MAIYEIPLTNKAQTFTVQLGATSYRLTLVWNSLSSNWNLDFATVGGVSILSGVPVVTGNNLLEQYAYLNFGGKLYAETINDPDSPPTYSNLGGNGKIYFITQ